MAVLRFSVFDLDSESGELRRQGRRLHLAAQPLKVLCLLAGRAGQVVTREELRRHLWGEDTFVAFDQGLNFCVASIRSVLGDDARNPRFIETLPRRGYRFLPDVRVAHATDVPEANQGTPGRTPKRPSWPATARRWSLAGALFLLATQSPSVPRMHSRANAIPAALAAFERAGETAHGPAGLRQRVHWYREAIRLDPRFAEAHFALGETYLRLVEKRELPAGTALAEARDAAVQAVDLEPVAETRQLLGTLRLLQDRDWDGARLDLAEATRLEPKWDSGLVSYARFLSASGEDAAALATIDRAEVLSPSCDLVLFDSGSLHYRARRYEVALGKLTRAAELGPPHDVSATDWRKEIQLLRIVIRMSQQEWAAAHREALEVLKLNGVADSVQHRFAALDARDALTAFFRKSIEMMKAPEWAGRIPPTRFARVHAALGESDAALDWLERAEIELDLELPYVLRNPEYDALRSQARFRALEQRIHSPRPKTLEASLLARLLPRL